MSSAIIQKLKQEIKQELLQEFILPILQERDDSKGRQHGIEFRDVLFKIARGNEELKNKRTKVVASPRELL